MSDNKRALLKQWLATGEIRIDLLTFPQRELWEASPVPVADVANHICCFIEVRGPITPEDCRAAVQRVVERQEVLRLSFLPGKGQPVQMIRANSDANFRFRDVVPQGGGPNAIEPMLQETFDEPFDLVQGPLYRVDMLRRADDDYVLVLAIHHSIADGWALGVFVQDLCAAYLQGLKDGRSELPAVPLSYTAWGAAERAFWQPPELHQRASFWQSTLAGAPRLWDARLKPAGSWSMTRRVSLVPADLARAVRELARQAGATLFSTLLAAFQLALSRWMGAQDIVVGTPVANRSRHGVREAMGYCAGVVPLRGQIDRGRPFADMLRAAHQSTVDCFANAMPFVELVRALGEVPSPAHNPVFDVRFALQNHPIPEVALPGLSARLRMRSTGTARFDLGCEITEEGDLLEVVWLFRQNFISQSEVENLERLFQTVLAGVCRSPAGRIGALIA